MPDPATEVVERIGPSPAYPYSPTSEQLPSERSVIFADPEDNLTYEFLEDTVLEKGENFMAHWVSPTLSRRGSGTEMTLRTLVLFYSATEDSSFYVDVSGNGGDSWPQTKQFTVLGTTDEIRRVRLSFNVTGYDLRFRIRFQEEEIIKIYSYYPSLIERGRLVL